MMKNKGLFSVSNQLILIDKKIQVKANLFMEDSNKSLLRTNNNETAKLIQYYLAHYTDTNSLGNYSGEQYKNEELEHVCPRAYMAHWEEFVYTKNQVVEYLKELKEKTEPAENGLFKLKNDLIINDNLSEGKDQVRFILSAEISSIYKKKW